MLFELTGIKRRRGVDLVRHSSFAKTNWREAEENSNLNSWNHFLTDYMWFVRISCPDPIQASKQPTNQKVGGLRALVQARSAVPEKREMDELFFSTGKKKDAIR